MQLRQPEPETGAMRRELTDPNIQLLGLFELPFGGQPVRLRDQGFDHWGCNTTKVLTLTLVVPLTIDQHPGLLQGLGYPAHGPNQYLSSDTRLALPGFDIDCFDSDFAHR